MDEREERIVEVEREPVVERHTTVIDTDGGGGRGGGGTLIAVLVLVVGLVVLFLLFGRGLLGGRDVDINVKTPDVSVPSTAPSK
jgi:hypothetical protein